MIGAIVGAASSLASGIAGGIKARKAARKANAVLDKQEKEIVELNPLNEFQQRAFDEVVQSFQEKNVCLLHGVTSSGKTEIYIHLIEEAIQGRKAGLGAIKN